MYYNSSDIRTPLCDRSVVQFDSGNRYVIVKYIGCGGFSLVYLAHKEGASAYVVIKELFPRNIDNAIVERRADGKIAIRNPLTDPEYADDKDAWNELNAYFQREALLARKAGIVYSAAGKEEQQNNSDVLKVEGPLCDIHGNYYLLIDTYQGEPLRGYIERGFVKNPNGEVLSNQNISGVLDILIKTSLRLSALHENAQMYHLDLSCDNIYLVKTAGGTALNPYIIDYGSAYCYEDPNEHIEHRFTCNPHSPPEVLALAQLQDESTGYSPDRSSDTYSLASILFYAATGKLFTPEMRTFSVEWKEQLRREYSANIPGMASEDSFSSELISFFEKGLAAAQRDRYTSSEQFIKELRQLKKKYKEYGSLLPLLKPDELMSYMVLDKHPLYNYRDEDGNIHVVCFGCGKFVKQMVLALLSTGQMVNCRLNIHIVSSEPKSFFLEFLRTAAPDLPRYSNLEWETENKNVPFLYDSAEEARKEQVCYVSFSYDCATDVTEQHTCAEILNKYSDAHYFIISLGRNSSNAKTAQLCSELLSARNEHVRNTIINYYCAEDAANNTRGFDNNTVLPEWLEVDAFADTLSGYSRTVRSLGLQTLKLAHLYDKLGNPRISMAESARRLTKDEYNQRSSCASALHLKYKLAGIGINPAPSTNIRSMISAYHKAVASDQFGILMELEHRRWLMYMVASGYRAPTHNELMQYGFEMVDGSFNDKWRCDAKRLHPCMFPSSGTGIAIQASDWDHYVSGAEIKKSGFDALDKASLYLHTLARRKCQDINADDSLDNLFRKIERKLNDAQAEAMAENHVDISARYANPRKLLLEARTTICDRARRLDYSDDGGLLTDLCQMFDLLGINITGEISAIKQYLRVFAEYAAKTDYKKPDETFIRNLSWLLFSKNDLPVIKLKGKTIADNITGPMILEPNSLIYFGVERNQGWIEFLRNHGFCGEITFIPYCGTTVSDMEHSLCAAVERCRKRCIIDITGADELMVIASTKLASKYEGLSLVRSSPEGVIENIHNFTAAPAYAFNSVISADEVYALHGARRNETEANRYMAQLSELVPVMWQFYREFQTSWEMITAFFAHRRASGAGIWINNIRVNDQTKWKRYIKDTVAMNHWKQLHLTEVFEQLRDSGFIRDLSIENRASKAVVSFLYPASNDESKPDYVFKSFNGLFGMKIPAAYSPFLCNVEYSEVTGYSVDIKSSCLVDCFSKKVDFSDQRHQRAGEEKRYPFALLEKPLRRMEELGLISDLEISLSNEGFGNSIRYVYSSLAVKECFITAGNILELYVWNEARNTRAFDDCESNFSFTWEDGVKNELDVVLTHGLGALVISCKTAKFNKEHLYEIKYLTERFSLNSKPVIVYSSTLAVEDGRLTDNLLPVKNRAKAMGVYLIDLNTLPANCSLGEKLVRIANGQDMP